MADGLDSPMRAEVLAENGVVWLDDLAALVYVD